MRFMFLFYLYMVIMTINRLTIKKKKIFKIKYLQK